MKKENNTAYIYISKEISVLPGGKIIDGLIFVSSLLGDTQWVKLTEESEDEIIKNIKLGLQILLTNNHSGKNSIKFLINKEISANAEIVYFNPKEGKLVLSCKEPTPKGLKNISSHEPVSRAERNLFYKALYSMLIE